jgi:hypothetical protein
MLTLSVHAPAFHSTIKCFPTLLLTLALALGPVGPTAWPVHERVSRATINSCCGTLQPSSPFSALSGSVQLAACTWGSPCPGGHTLQRSQCTGTAVQQREQGSSSSSSSKQACQSCISFIGNMMKSMLSEPTRKLCKMILQPAVTACSATGTCTMAARGGCHLIETKLLPMRAKRLPYGHST